MVCCSYCYRVLMMDAVGAFEAKEAVSTSFAQGHHSVTDFDHPELQTFEHLDARLAAHDD